MLANVHSIFGHCYVVSKIEKEEKMEEKQMRRSKRSFTNHWLMVRLNLSSHDLRNCKETIRFVKELRKNYWISEERNPKFSI